MEPRTTNTALLIEDDTRLGQLTREYLERQGFIVTWATTGTAGLEEATRFRFDVVLLDLMLPGLPGLEVCRILRTRNDSPIIMLTARGDESDRILGLELGADDYLVKPFSPRELLARMHALLRRTRGQAGPATRHLRVGPLEIDPASRTVTLQGENLALTGYEFSILYALADRAGRILAREQLMELAQGNPDEAFERSIDVHISRLRQKLGDDPRQPRFIKTIRGAGYMMASWGKEP